MKTLKAIIVDDEPLARELLESILSDFDDVEITASCANGEQAIDAVIKTAPDVMFLDIEMPGLGGFDVIQSLQSDILPKIIFTTAYAQYALDAFKVNALNYILKPVHETAVAESLERVKNSVEAETKSKIMTVLEKDSPQRTPALIDLNKITMANAHNILWLEAAGDYVYVHFDQQTKIIRRTLKAFMAELPPHLFQRIHRSTIVNIEHIDEFIAQKKGEAILVMSDQNRLKASRSYGAVVKDRLKAR